ncbi:MAG: FtsW/RodA/SpoVE family cell cycle protein [Ignavibacteriales bacterium]|nr:MAG: cell division protein [Ignavibacteriaceae bacterium]MBW7874010.1 FtsW/RodA/SpoVE family cell cycle protein [Ignavibacteria bacterium]MCZ2143110.1 FtsW/RodA/SpoVE family cell cycle protein [Ignavibacteriales bacterium]OQY78129.1 MAG: hypothetical protein B6D45_02375 [Ignavibacteriales bacterium UTCHB3]MBV6443991.1 putative lipid II flippase FtsW [Ignavibacteriaceae bacterium]
MKLYSTIIFICAVALMIGGSLMVLSASSTFSAITFQDAERLFTGHLGKVIIGFILMVIMPFFDYRIYKKYSKYLLIFGILLLIAVLFTAPSIKGSMRVISLGGMSFQPVELVKLLLFIHIAALLERTGEEITDLKRGVVIPMVWIGSVALLVFLQPNVSNGVLILVTGIAMMFVAGIRVQHFMTFAGAGGALAILYALIKPHSLKRISTYLGAVFGSGEFHPQVLQSLYGLGSGGLLGVGLGKSAQRNLFLPEAYGDFIFAILGEELGFIGTVVTLLLYATIFVLGILIAKNAPDKFGKLLAFSIALSIPLYAFVNAAVAIGVFPVTGLPLPLISHGGTAVIIVCMSLGILLSIGMHTKPKGSGSGSESETGNRESGSSKRNKPDYDSKKSHETDEDNDPLGVFS